MQTQEPVPTLALRDIRKTFGGVVAIEKISLEVNAGEIVALVGDNGAGKTTLVKIISGVHKPDDGQIAIDGQAMAFTNASSARHGGIEVVYQDLALAEQQPVYMNLFLGREITKGWILDRKRMIYETEQLVQELDVRIPSARAEVRNLSGGQRQGIAIARATHWASKLILLDEPTAALGVAETAKVEKLILTLKKRNIAILLISHNLDQVFRLADRICVLRRGLLIGIRSAKTVAKGEIVAMITGLQ